MNNEISRKPARRLWAPGGYLRNCIICQDSFVGDKRASHCSVCAYKIVWELSEGLEYIRPLEQQCFNMGFNIGLMGSVIHKGWSGKDLDIVAVPANWRSGPEETTLLVHARALIAFTRMLAGPEGGFQIGEWNKMTVKATYRDPQGRLIDWFVSYSSAEGKLL